MGILADSPVTPRMPSDMISIQEARGIVLDHASGPRGRERVGVVDAVGRVLAEAVVSDTDLPPFDRVTMDGFAVRSADLDGASDARPVRLPVAATVAAGEEAAEPVAPGTVHRIMTGAPLPPGADAVVPVEWTASDGDDAVRFLRAPAAGANVAPKGEDLARGRSVGEAGLVVDAMTLPVLIGAGAGTVHVARRPRVSLMTSGDELVPPGQPIERGQIRESNGPMLAALFAAAGAEVVNLGVSTDDRDALGAMFERALDGDVVVLTGGASVGDFDFTSDVLDAFGCERHFDRLAAKPGKPTLFATRGEQLVFGLPGNPVAALMTGRVLVAAALASLSGIPVEVWPSDERPLLDDVPRNGRRDLLLPVEVRPGGLHFPGWHGSGDLTSIARRDGFAYVARGDGACPAGTPTTFFPLPRPGCRTW